MEWWNDGATLCGLLLGIKDLATGGMLECWNDGMPLRRYSMLTGMAVVERLRGIVSCTRQTTPPWPTGLPSASKR
jgi:hypothetical protein